MTDLLFPPHARVSSQQITAVSNAAASRSPFSGAARSVARAGSRWRFGLRSLNTSEREDYSTRANLQAHGFEMDGQANRCLFGDPAYRQRGSFAAPEIFSNPTFANSTTGWSGYSTTPVLTSSDRILRVTQSQTGTSGFYNTSSITSLIQYAPYVLRAMIRMGRVAGDGGNLRLGASVGTAEYIPGTTFTSPGMMAAAGVPYSSSSAYAVIGGYSPVTGLVAGDYFECPYASLSRCALVDNGSNLLTRSDDLSNAAWTGSAATATFGATGPDGSATASRFLETNANSAHFLQHSNTTVAAGVLDYAFTCVFLAGTRNWAYLQLNESTGTTAAACYFNISTGAIGTITTGANWASVRAFVANMGGGYYRCTIVARKTNAATAIAAIIGSASADNTASYTGVAAANSFNMWRATVAQSSVPTRQVSTAATAAAATAQTGSGLHIKGLPASTANLLIRGDRVQLGNQLCKVVAPLNSDASQLGYLQLAYGPRTGPADNAPVIINNPMGRFILTGNESGWSDAPGLFSDFDFELEESLDVA